jgi:hypothetical protein
MSGRTITARRYRRTPRSAQRIRPMVQELEPRNQPAGLGLSVALLHAEGLTHAAALSVNVPDLISFAPIHAVSVVGHDSLSRTSTPISAASSAAFPEFFSALELFEARSIEVFGGSINVVAVPIAEVITVTTPEPAARVDATVQSSEVEVSAVKTRTPAPEAPSTSQTTPASTTPVESTGNSGSTKATPKAKSPAAISTTVPAATVGTAVRGTGAPIAGLGTTPFVIVNAAPVLAGGGPTGGGALGAPALGALPFGAAVLPGAVGTTGTVTGGTPEAETPAADQPPVIAPDTGGANESSAPAAVGDEAPVIATRLEGFLAVLAAAAYGVWHWRRRGVTTTARQAWYLARRGSPSAT